MYLDSHSMCLCYIRTKLWIPPTMIPARYFNGRQAAGMPSIQIHLAKTAHGIPQRVKCSTTHGMTEDYREDHYVFLVRVPLDIRAILYSKYFANHLLHERFGHLPIWRGYTNQWQYIFLVGWRKPRQPHYQCRRFRSWVQIQCTVLPCRWSERKWNPHTELQCQQGLNEWIYPFYHPGLRNSHFQPFETVWYTVFNIVYVRPFTVCCLNPDVN